MSEQPVGLVQSATFDVTPATVPDTDTTTEETQ